MGHSNRRPLVRSSRRSSQWSAGSRVSTLQSVTAAGKTTWDVGQVSTASSTVIRIRGHFTAQLSVVTTAHDGYSVCGIGIGVVSDDAFQIGSSAMPGPISDSNWDWMFVNYFSLVGESVTESFQGLGAIRIPIDSKAMRKLKPNQVVFGMLETSNEVGAATIQLQAMTRMFIKT